jgi:hypothetical protein
MNNPIIAKNYLFFKRIISMFFRLLIVYGLLSWQPSLATEMKQLYKTEVIAFSQEPDDRRAALEEALTTVLQRILPDTLINSNDPRIKKALHNAESFIKNEYTSDVNSVYSGDTLARTLHLEFDGPRLQRFIQQLQLTTLQEKRPETLVWLIIDDHGEKKIFKPNTMPEIDAAVFTASKQKGLPLRFPKTGAAHTTHSSNNQSFQPNAEQLIKISSGYPVKNVLAGQLINQTWCWESEWTLYFSDNLRRWKGECKPLQEAVSDGINGTYEQMLNEYQSSNETFCGGTSENCQTISATKKRPKQSKRYVNKASKTTAIYVPGRRSRREASAHYQHVTPKTPEHTYQKPILEATAPPDENVKPLPAHPFKKGHDGHVLNQDPPKLHNTPATAAEHTPKPTPVLTPKTAPVLTPKAVAEPTRSIMTDTKTPKPPKLDTKKPILENLPTAPKISDSLSTGSEDHTEKK